MNPKHFPAVENVDLVGSYDAIACAGGGYTWDAVLEYRVWMHPERGAPDEHEGNDYYFVFHNCDDAFEFSRSNVGAEEPLALVLQREHISEPEPGVYEHVTEERITEWPVEFLSRPRRTDSTILNFFAHDAPPNKLDILRGLP